MRDDYIQREPGSAGGSPQMVNRLRCEACESILRTANPVPVGKKLKCPNCGQVTRIEVLPEDREEQFTSERRTAPQSHSRKDVSYQDEREPAASGPSRFASMLGWLLFLGSIGGGSAMGYMKWKTEKLDIKSLSKEKQELTKTSQPSPGGPAGAGGGGGGGMRPFPDGGAGGGGRPGAGGGGRPGAGGGGRPGGGGNRPSLAERFKGWDKDQDGKLTGDEIPERMKDRVADIDKDKDMAITLEELQEARRGNGGGGGGATPPPTPGGGGRPRP